MPFPAREKRRDPKDRSGSRGVPWSAFFSIPPDGGKKKRIAGYTFSTGAQKKDGPVSLYCMARIRRLDQSQLQLAEVHARRGDVKSQKRVVRDAAPVTWLPGKVSSDPLSYEARYMAHVEGAFVPKGDAKAIHMLVKFPASVAVATTEEAEVALKLAVDFASSIFGDEAVFAARMDRDEKSLTNADLFIAPRYVKKTKRQEKVAVSLSRHLKLMTEKHGTLATDRDILRSQGRALQDAFATFLRANGYQALRGEPKKEPEPD